VALVTIDVLEERIASIFRVEIISELEAALAVTSIVPSSLSSHPDDRGDTFFRNVCSYKSHTASQSRRQHSALRVGGVSIGI
jgi:hypothetical protein